MAKDYRGILLIMLAICRSTKGREVLRGQKHFKDAHDTALDDWLLLIETMLEWESYLNEPLMYKKHVKRLEKKHRFIMYLMRKVAMRQTGMGLKLLKFHTILHIWEDILQFGVPLEINTSFNESFHKPSKQAAKMTQKAADTFNYQTATRLVEFDLLDLAMAEIEFGLVPWLFYDRIGEEIGDKRADDQSDDPEIWTGDTRISVFRKRGKPNFQLHTKSKFADKTRMNTDLLAFLNRLQDKIRGYQPTELLPIYTCHRRKGQIFRGHPNFRGKGAWRDWVWVNWGTGYGRLPSHIYCFVVLKNMPSGANTIHFGGIPLQDGVFAVVETANPDVQAQECPGANLITPYLKECEVGGNGRVRKRTFYLANTDAFEDPCCVIPDLGGPTNRYFVVKPRNSWAAEFVQWVEAQHTLDEMDDMATINEDIEEGSSNDDTGKVGGNRQKKRQKRSNKTRKRGKR